MASLVAQAVYFGFGLDAFRRDGDAEALAEADDRTHDRLRVGVGGEVAHEGLVDLDLVERKAAQVAQAGIAGAEIVHRDANTERAQRMQGRQHLAALFQKQRLRDLEFQALRRQTGLLQRIHDQRQQVAEAELQR